LQESSLQALVVLEQGKLVGLLTAENLGELLMIREALKQSGSARAPLG
jgi:hypothetical protein